MKRIGLGSMAKRNREWFLRSNKNAIQGGFMFRPPWFDAMQQFQPIDWGYGEPGRVKALRFPEDRLLDRLGREMPQLWDNTVMDLLPDDTGNHGYTHPANVFLNKWKMYMEEGMEEEAAYNEVKEDWKRQRRFERIELRIAMEQATEAGAALFKEDVAVKRVGLEYEQKWIERNNRDRQARREEIEMEVEFRKTEGAREPFNFESLDPETTQEELDDWLSSDPDLREYVGSGETGISLGAERLMPKPWRDRTDFLRFRAFLDRMLTPESREMLRDQMERWPNSTQTTYFRGLLDADAEHREPEGDPEVLGDAMLDHLDDFVAESPEIRELNRKIGSEPEDFASFLEEEMQERQERNEQYARHLDLEESEYSFEEQNEDDDYEEEHRGDYFNRRRRD